MKNAPSYRMVFGIMATLFLATGIAGSIVAISQGQKSSLHHISDHLPGLTLEKAPEPQAGLIVTSLQSEGPAELAGLAVGDDVLAVDQRPVGSLGDLREALLRNQNGAIQLLVLHKDVPIDVSLSRSEDHLHGA
jgi:S1-C subfamily serine protease